MGGCCQQSRRQTGGAWGRRRGAAADGNGVSCGVDYMGAMTTQDHEHTDRPRTVHFEMGKLRHVNSMSLKTSFWGSLSPQFLAEGKDLPGRAYSSPLEASGPALAPGPLPPWPCLSPFLSHAQTRELTGGGGHGDRCTDIAEKDA